jgi:HlyD family secretion protein
MDHARPKSNARLIKRVVAGAAVGIAAITGAVTLANIDFSSTRVAQNKISIATVQRGAMDVRVVANGQLLPRHFEQVASQVAGRVARADIKPGAIVHVGQVLVVLTNPQLVTSAEEARSAWEGAVAEEKAAESDQQTAVMNQEVVVTAAQVTLDKARLKLDADTQLANDKLISTIDLKRSQLDVASSERTCSLEQHRLERLQANVEAQLSVKKARVAQLARALERARTEAADLNIVAGINGIVQAIAVDVGQQLQPGSPVGRIAQQDQLYAELKVPARDATQVQPGQTVSVDTRNGIVPGVVTRVDPGVTEGTVVVDADLKGTLPAGARPQLQVEGVIFISQLENTLYVGKPAFVQGDAPMSVYKLDPDGRYATRVTIRAGKVSVNYLQILQGLQAGDRIITSEYGGWQGKDRILLK